MENKITMSMMFLGICAVTLAILLTGVIFHRSFQLQMELISPRRDALLEHGIVVAEVFEDHHGFMGSTELLPTTCDSLRRQFHIPNGHFRVMLVGRDAHIKMVADSCVSCEEVIMRIEHEPQLTDAAFE